MIYTNNNTYGPKSLIGFAVKGGIRAANEMVAAVAILLPVEKAVTEWPAPFAMTKSIRHDRPSNYCELCSVGEVRRWITSPLILADDLKISGLIYVAGAAVFVRRAPALTERAVGGLALTRTLLAGVVFTIRDPGQQKGRVEANGTTEWLIR